MTMSTGQPEAGHRSDEWDEILGVPIGLDGNDGAAVNWQAEFKDLDQVQNEDIARTEVFVSGTDAEQLIEQDGVFYAETDDSHILAALDEQENRIAKANRHGVRENGELKPGTYHVSADIPLSPGSYFKQYSAPMEKEALLKEFPNFATPTGKNHRHFLPTFEEASKLEDTIQFDSETQSPTKQLNFFRPPSPQKNEVDISIPTWNENLWTTKTNQTEKWCDSKGDVQDTNHICQTVKVTITNPSCKPCCNLLRDTLPKRFHFHHSKSTVADSNHIQIENSGIQPISIRVQFQANCHSVEVEVEPSKCIVAPGSKRKISIRHVLGSQYLRNLDTVSTITGAIKLIARGGGKMSSRGDPKSAWSAIQMFSANVIVDRSPVQSSENAGGSSLNVPKYNAIKIENNGYRKRHTTGSRCVEKFSYPKKREQVLPKSSITVPKQLPIAVETLKSYSTSSQVVLPRQVYLVPLDSGVGTKACAGQLCIRNLNLTECLQFKVVGESLHGFSIPSIVSWEISIPPQETETIDVPGRFLANQQGNILQKQLHKSGTATVGKLYILSANNSGWVPVVVRHMPPVPSIRVEHAKDGKDTRSPFWNLHHARSKAKMPKHVTSTKIMTPASVPTKRQGTMKEQTSFRSKRSVGNVARSAVRPKQSSLPVQLRTKQYQNFSPFVRAKHSLSNAVRTSMA